MSARRPRGPAFWPMLSSSTVETPSSPMPRSPALVLVLTALLMLGMGAAWAQGRGRGGPPAPQFPPQPQRDRHDTLSDSVRRVERDTRGQVLSAERVPFDGREMHRVKVLDDRGRVRVYMDDPQRRRSEERRPERRPPTRDDDD